MKDISELNIPADLRFSDDHEWARQASGVVRIGICDYAQDQLGDIVYVELPKIGQRLQKNDVFGTVESVKAVSECLMPLSGEVVGVNEALASAPEQVNASPYDKGWMIEVKASDDAEFTALMDRPAYLEFLQRGH
jgi:glycine cleavage system H protein